VRPATLAGVVPGCLPVDDALDNSVQRRGCDEAAKWMQRLEKRQQGIEIRAA